jgi:hypothetical protein
MLTIVTDIEGPNDTALALALEGARCFGYALCVLCVVKELPTSRRAGLLRGQQIGDLLTLALLQLGHGELPVEVTVVVYHGTAGEAARLLNETVRPDVALLAQSTDIALEAEMLSEDCSVIQIADVLARAAQAMRDPGRHRLN